MKDRELLERAARAHGGLEYVEDVDAWIHVTENGLRGAWWFPLGDDGDALRLAVKLNLSVFCPDGEPSAVARWHPWTELNRAEEAAKDDPYAATRRAIVRAAAAMAPEEAK